MKTSPNDLDREQVETARRSARARQAVREELQQLMEDVEELARRVGDAADPELDSLRERMNATIASARDAIESRTEWPRQRAREALNAGAAYVREQPWQVIGMASLLGIAIGVLVARR